MPLSVNNENVKNVICNGEQVNFIKIDGDPMAIWSFNRGIKFMCLSNAQRIQSVVLDTIQTTTYDGHIFSRSETNIVDNKIYTFDAHEGNTYRLTITAKQGWLFDNSNKLIHTLLINETNSVFSFQGPVSTTPDDYDNVLLTGYLVDDPYGNLYEILEITNNTTQPITITDMSGEKYINRYSVIGKVIQPGQKETFEGDGKTPRPGWDYRINITYQYKTSKYTKSSNPI